MAEKKRTRVCITSSLQKLMYAVIEEIGYSKTTYLYRAIKTFLEGECEIDERLRITKRTDPLYVKKDVTEQILIDCEQDKILDELAGKIDVKKTVIIFQALLNYTCVNAELLGVKIDEES